MYELNVGFTGEHGPHFPSPNLRRHTSRVTTIATGSPHTPKLQFGAQRKILRPINPSEISKLTGSKLGNERRWGVGNTAPWTNFGRCSVKRFRSTRH
ncbi:hypothetical protein M407DRAFT_162517 [Tulasnella calospora MUT 4182]|uniref:Uncharacterized protein n=1 Tax=Tulasnella calospora MUT 4182 TaxID=1051891 RepID=A0A0C3M849_9AGAM|nr:hypothetical protein M407DRAFT_162517 [Tulasnella calospora MUT 4182]